MNQSGTRQPVVFLDRDGTLNEEAGYISDLSQLRLIPGAADAVALLNRAGVACILATNQTGAARGYYSEQHIRDLNHRLVALLAAGGARLDALYYCPHLKEGTVSPYAIECSCRKPAAGMVERAFQEHPLLDRGRAYVVGDKATDVELARNCQAKGVLVTTGYGQRVLDGSYQWPVQPDFIAGEIGQAVSWILADLRLPAGTAG